MRKWNAILSMAILILFLLHAVLGGFQMIGVGNTAVKPVAWLTAALIGIHTVIGVKLTADSLRVWKKTGVSYFRENKLFWARRISGFAVMLLLFFHLTAFGYTSDGVYRLKRFTGARLAANLLLVVALAVHVIANVRPLLIALGIRRLRQWAGDILFVLSVLLLLMAVAFLVYYLRWNVW